MLRYPLHSSFASPARYPFRMAGKKITITLEEDEAKRVWRELRDLEDVMKNVPLCLERLKRQIREQINL